MKKYFVLFFMVFVGLFACNKDDSTLNKKGGESPSVKFREGMNEPILNQGVLWFDDDNHVDMYYDYLDSLYEIPKETEDEMSALAQNEAKFDNFVSLRSTFEDAESQEDPFCKDDVEMSMLNVNSEIGIGDYIYFLRLGERYKVHKDNAASIAAVRAYPKEELLPDDVLLGYGIEVLYSNWGKTVLRSGQTTNTTTITFDWPPVVVTDRDHCMASALVFKDNNECETQKRVGHVNINYFPAADDASKKYGVLISWGDNSPPVDEPTNSGSTLFTHEYASDGISHIRVMVFAQGSCYDPDGPLLDKMADLEFHSCKRKFISHYDTDCVSGDWKIDLKTWNALSATGKKERVFARACSYKKRNGKWRERWHWKKIEINAKWRQRDECKVVESETKSRHGAANRCRRVKVVFNDWYDGAWHENGDITSFARFPISDNCELEDELIFCK